MMIIELNEDQFRSYARFHSNRNYFQTVDINYYTENNFTNNLPIFTLKGGISKYRVYMWIEGQDVDCENNASVGNISLNLQFSTNPS